MRGLFSIEWLAQSSQSTGTDDASSAGLRTSGTTSESLPGFYCRPRDGQRIKQEVQDGGDQGSDGHGLPRLAGSELGALHHNYHHLQQVAEHGFSSGTEEETSGYESEGGRSLSPVVPDGASSPLSPVAPDGSASPASGRRPRTAFTAEQISSLERSFKRNAYLGTQDKAELCRKLSLSDKQVRNWFQNRRMKLKRTVQDALAHACQANVASQLLHYPELQSYRSGPYPRYHPAAAQEAPGAAPAYLHPHGLHYGPAAGLPGVSALPGLDPFYQYPSLPGVLLPTGAAQLMGSYQAFPQQY